MVRLLVLIALVVAALWLVRRALRPPEPQRARAPEPAKADELVRCAHCGVLLPRAEARQHEGVLYCGEEHARRGPAR